MNRQKPIEHHKKSTNPIFFHPSTSLCNDTRFIARFENSRDRSLAGLQLHLHFRAIFGYFCFIMCRFTIFLQTEERRRRIGADTMVVVKKVGETVNPRLVLYNIISGSVGWFWIWFILFFYICRSFINIEFYILSSLSF